MEGSSKPETETPGLCRTSRNPGPPRPDPPETFHSQVDSFLTAARLVRKGWTEEGKKTGRQFSQFLGCSARQPCPSRSVGDQGPNWAETGPKDPQSGRVLVVNGGKAAGYRETDSEKETDEVKQKAEWDSSAYRRAERRRDIVCIWTSGCRITCRQTRRFKAPILPVIAEI